MSDSIEIQTMRMMEWERAKGSIRAILSAYWEINDDKYAELDGMAREFMRKFGEAGGLV